MQLKSSATNFNLIVPALEHRPLPPPPPFFLPFSSPRYPPSPSWPPIIQMSRSSRGEKKRRKKKENPFDFRIHSTSDFRPFLMEFSSPSTVFILSKTLKTVATILTLISSGENQFSRYEDKLSFICSSILRSPISRIAHSYPTYAYVRNL